MEKMKANEGLFAIKALIVALLIVCGVAPAMASHDTHYARVSVTATGNGKVYMTTKSDYAPTGEDWQNSMSGTWNCDDGVDDENDTRIYYVHAQAESGYHFEKWSSNSSGTDSKSTDAKYAYSTSASSTSSGSPTANSLYAIFAVNPTYTCTLLTSENGTYKYRYGESEEVTVESEHSVTTNQNFTFTALPAAGYMLYGWYTKSGETKTYFDYTSTTISSYALPGNISIGVDFVPAGTPIFQIKGTSQTYTDLNAAISACGSATKTIMLINSGTLPAGNYTIPANVTLLIPFDEGFTCYTTTPALTTNAFLTPEVYRTLTMSPGANLTVNGAISVSAKLSSKSGYGPNGATSGKYGAIKMLSEGNAKSQITLNNGAKLYGWGYIYGEGAVEALSGSTVYEGFVITDWRGGNNTLDIYNKRSTYKVFPFNQYYIQNIEVPLTIHKGATESVYSSVYGDGSDNPLSITMVGESSGLFRLTGTGAKLTKWYDPLYDRQHYELEGAAAINAISFTAFSMTVSSSAFVLPITNNMDITVRSGATVSIAEDVCIMPDASVTVEQGATMNIAKNVYVYDIQACTNAGTYTTDRGGYPSAGAGRYAAGAYVRRISYSPSWAALSDREIRRLQNMSSAHFQVNGTLNVSGKLYTTEGGADIFSTTDGAVVNLATGAGAANKTYQVDHENYDAYYYTIPVTSAQLHNADGSYQATAGNAANTAWTYANGHWGWCIVWRLEDGTELKRMYQPAQPDAAWLSSNAPATSKPDEGTCSFVFNGWNTETFTSRQEMEVTADYTKTCAEYYDVLWKSEDGTETYETDENVGKGETTRYNGAAPVKADDEANGFTYTFDGWTTEPNGGGTKYNIGETPAATGNATYYAHFAATEVAAIITANGVVNYYPSIADAFTAANTSDYTPTIQVWRDATNTPALTYTGKNHCTLDLNGHTVSGTEMPLLTINDDGFTFTITDLTETKEGKLAGISGASTAFVVSLVSGVFRLEAGTVYGQNTGTGVMAGVYAGANREVIMTGGTIQVDAARGTGYGIFAQGKGTINGGTIRVESSAKSAYAVQAQGSNGIVTVTDGKFYAAGSSTGTVTCVLANGSASLTVNGGYYNTATNLTTYLGAGCHVINLPSSELPYKYKVGAGGYTVTFQNTDGTVLQSGLWENDTTPEYTGETPTKPGDTGGEYIHSSWTPDLAPVTGDATYTATYIPAPPVASVTISGTTTEYIHFSDAWTAANSATAASTLKLLQDVTFTAKLTYNNSNNKDCILDLNGHTLTSSTPEQSPLHINNTNVTFTITDDTEGKSGNLSLNSSSSSTIFGAFVDNGTLQLNAGTIEVISGTATACGVTINSGTFTMNGGTIHVKTTNNKDGRGIYANFTTTVNGGTVHVEAAGTAYGVRHDGGIMTINDGKFSISGSTASFINYTDAADNKLIIKGGYYNIDTRLGTYVSNPYHIFELTSGAEFDEGYRYKVAEAYNLTWTTDGELSGEGYTPAGLTAVGTPIVAPTSTKEGYVFAGWTPAVAAAMPSADTEYTAQWAVASVTIGETTTLHTTFADAWTVVNSASAASTLKLLDDVDLTTGLEYTNASKNCTLDLNGHIISGSATPLLKIAQNGITFTITDLSEVKEGRIECNTHINGQKWAVEVSQSTLRFEGGTIYAKNTQAGTLFIGIYSGASGVIEISGGNIHTVTTANNPTYGVLTFGTATISSGSIQVEAAGTGYAVEAYGDNTNILITGGNFYATGSSAACVHRSKGTLTLRGGYYNSDTNLAAQCATNYHVFPNDDATYLYKVAEGYTVTFNANGHGSAPEAQLIEKNAHASEPTAPTAEGYTFGGWYKEAECETPWNFTSDVVTAATTLFAKWTLNTYTINYELNDGIVYPANPESYTVESSTITLNNPTKANYVFAGWTGTDLASATMNVTIPAGSTGDRSYTATWTPAVASVTVNEVTTYYTTFDDAWAAVNSATAESTIQLLQNVTVTSYKTYNNGFNQNCTLDLNGHILTSNTSEISPLHINNANVTFTITDGTEGKSGKLSLNTSSSSTIFGVYVQYGAFRLEGGTIEVTSSTATTCGVTIHYGTFTMNGGTIHVRTTNGKEGRGIYANSTTTVNGGTVYVEAAGTAYGIRHDAGTMTINDGKFTISGSTASYMNYKAAADSKLIIKGGYYTINSRLATYVSAPYHVFDLTSGTEFDEGYLYKVAEGYNVTFNTNGHGSAPEAQLIEKNAHASEPTALTATGYTFGGWYKEAECETPWNFTSDVVTAATTLFAKWTVHTHKFAWDFNGGTPSGSYTEANDALAYGSVISYPTMTKTGYTFAGWSSDATTMPDNDLIITASWTINQYTISFDSNGGSAVASITQDYNTAVTTPASPSRTGYTFDGWSPAVPNPMPAEDTECEAQWTRDTYTISYDLAGGSVTSANPTSYTVESSTITLNNPTKANYVFAGWTGTDLAVATMNVTISAGSTGDRSYTATWTPAVASVTVNDATTLYTTFDDAWPAVNSAGSASTIQLLQDVTINTQLTYDNTNTQNCTLDLNGHTLTSTTNSRYPLYINKTGVTFTITDSGASGTLLLNTTSTSAIFGAFVDNGTLLLNAGTIEVTSSTATTCGVTANSNGTFTMNAGTIHVVTTNSKEGRGIYSAGSVTVHDGTIHVEAAGDGYGLKRDAGTITVNNGKFNITGSTASVSTNANPVIQGGYYNINSNLGTCVPAPYHVFDLTSGTEFDEGYRYKVSEGYTVTFKNEDETLQSGLWEKGTTPVYAGTTPTKAATAQYTYTFDDWSPAITPVTANATYTAQFSSTVNIYTVTWKNADGTTLETDENVPYGTTPEYNGATPTKATDASYGYTFNGWSPAVEAVSSDAVYTATYSTSPTVASVTIGEDIEYYTDFADAWTAATGAGSASTLTLLGDVAGLASSRTYSASHDLTLDLNGHTLSGSSAETSMFQVNCTGHTFTVTDGSANHDGKLSFSSGSGSTSHCVIVTNGTFVLEAGMIEATSSTASIGAVHVTGGTFTMNENGAVHAIYTGNVAGKNSRFVNATGGTTNINGGTIHLESTKDGIGVVHSSGTVTITGGNFKIEAGGTAAVTNKTETINSLNIQGGYYSANKTQYFEPHVKAPYYIYPNSDETYIYRVAETYTVTFQNEDGTTLQSDLMEKGAIPAYTGETPTKPADAQYTYTFNGWSPAVSKVTADATYTAQFSSTVNTYTVTWKNADGTTLETDENVPYGTTPEYNGATPTKATDASYAYAFDTWSPEVGTVTGDVTYTATYTTTPVVASVTINSTTRYYTTLAAAWTAVNTATAASTLTLLQDVSITDYLQHNNSNNKNCTLNLNGHTLSSTTAQALLYINKAGITFTITDLTESKAGGLHMESNETGNRWCVYVKQGNLQLEAGTIFLRSKADTRNEGVRIDPAESTFTMNGGKIHVVTTDSKPARGIVSRGIAVINDGEIQVEASGTGYGIEASVSEGNIGNVTVTGGKFLVTGSTAACAYKSAAATLTLQGGYYNIDANLATHTTTPYEVQETTAADKEAVGSEYNYKVVERIETGAYLDIIDWTASTLTINANGWTASGWPYTINDDAYDKNDRAADRTLTIPYSGEAGADLVIKLQDKDENIISQHSYKIPFIGTTAGAGTEDTVYVNEGTLTISTNTTLGGLYVRPEASVEVTNGSLTVGKLVMRTLPWQAAAISGSFTATETWYTRIAPNKRTISGPDGEITYESASYYQFALPLSSTVALKDIKVSHGANTPYGTTWLLKSYNEASRAEYGTSRENWDPLTENDFIQGGVGYEMFSNSNYYREFYFPVGAVNSASLGKTTTVAYDLGAAGVDHAGWNIVASPLMGVYDNSGANPETGMKVNWLMTDGSYDQGVPDYIYPAIPFSYQATQDGYIDFSGTQIQPSLAPRRIAAEDESVRIQWIHLDVKNDRNIGDHTSILAHPTRYEESYKTGIDLAKQSFTASRALVYSSHAYGEMAFAGVGDSLLARGIAITVYSPRAQELTFSMRENNWLNRLAAVWLIDNETGYRTDLLWSTYTFDAPEGTTAGRFTIAGEFYAPQIATGMEGTSARDNKARKVLIDQKMYILVNGQVFDATGKMVTE